MKKMYKYCTVVPKFRETDFYYYLDCSGDVKKGSYVVAPFGNNEIIGKVTKVENFEEENVPFPIDKMKSISCIISKKEYDEFSIADFLGADEEDWYELEEGDRVIIKANGGPTGIVIDKAWSDYAHDYEYKVEPDNYDEYWELQCYSCYELEKYEVLGKVQYIGKDMFCYLINEHVYDVIEVNNVDGIVVIKIIDGEYEPSIYEWENPCNLMDPELCGKWKIVEDIDRKLSRMLKSAQFPKGVIGDD